MRILVTMPHFFLEGAPDATNKSRRLGSRPERLRALFASVTALHQTLGAAIYGLDHARLTAWQAKPATLHTLDLVICTVGDSHLLGDLQGLAQLYRNIPVTVDPMMIGFECHRLLGEARGRYDYYCYIEDDVVLNDPWFFRKRELFDSRYAPDALLQPNRYELAPSGPVSKLYVDYFINPKLTEKYQNVSELPRLELPFAGEMICFERTTYPSSGCFFLSASQLEKWTAGPHFLDGDVSYMSPLDSAAALSIMKTFRVYKPVLEQAWFFEVFHASPRWISAVDRLKLMSR
jgi:hypothetical protein